IISERFNINVEFGQGSISYKETIESPVEGIGHYEPLRHYAEVHLLLEPMPRGSGVVFDTDCSRDELALNWQRLVMTHLEEKTHIGVLTGSPITDIKITLIAGRAHLKHTEGGDFRQSTYRAVRHGLRCAKSVLLEPWYEFKIELPSEYVGRAMSDVQQMGGSFSPPENTGNMSILTGSAPVSEMRSYHNVLISYTKGKGKISCDLKGYEKCHNAQEVIESIGYDADSDTENTADSVFCAHGAGFVVNWKNVTEYKHIDTGLDFSPPDKEEVEERVNNYIGEIINDKELMRIFERTYGPIKRPQHEAFKLKKERTSTTVKSSKSNIATGGKEYLLVDGYNIVFAWEDLKEMAKTNLDLARNTLVNMLCNYQGFKQCEVILVFDAYKVKKNPGEIEKIHNISVVYTKEAETADTYIERVSHELSKKNKVMVATSDNLEQLIIFGNGAMRISAKAFRAEIDETQRQISRFLSEN
ncbi:MAG: NYN domain-containing protein, partial [Clostridia bacterium]|nr:NYN domain-containing protein [Clostridia bacterium]